MRRHALAAALCIPLAHLAHLALEAETLPAKGAFDSRVGTVVYNADEVYRLQGRVGYQIDLQFERGESFIGLGAGDAEGLSFAAQDNHLFLKPKATAVDTNLTVLTSRRAYQFEYSASQRPQENLIYVLKFSYPPGPAALDTSAKDIERRLETEPAAAARNLDYWYCGQSTLRPLAASDDGVQTRLRFGARSDLPAIFVRNDDGSESLLNFSINGDDVVIHRVARRFVVRRGLLTGCIVNRSFNGSGTRLRSGTVSPGVERDTRVLP
jgi:type IV secretion system protein VirB9